MRAVILQDAEGIVQELRRGWKQTGSFGIGTTDRDFRHTTRRKYGIAYTFVQAAVAHASETVESAKRDRKIRLETE